MTAKIGWQYLWVRHEDREDGAQPNNGLVKKPVAAYVEELYGASNFNNLLPAGLIWL